MNRTSTFRKSAVAPLRGRSKGFVLIATATALTVLAGVTGMAVDIGRMYIAKNELQTFTDAAAIAASMELNGQLSGITAAKTAAWELPNQWNFGSGALTAENRSIEFADSPTATTWIAEPTAAQAATLTVARVKASAPMKLYLLPAVKTAMGTYIGAQSTAEQKASDSIGGGHVLPFSPIAPDPSATDFGFAKGVKYTMRWASNFGTSGPPPNGSVCAGDEALGWGDGSTIKRARDGASSTRGFFGSEASSDIDLWIANGYPLPLVIGCTIGMADGTKNGRANTLNDRVDSDTDHSSPNFASYEAHLSNGKRSGNGRRVIALPINDGTAATVIAAPDDGTDDGHGHNGNGHQNGHGPTALELRTVIGFGAFFLDNTDYGDTNGNEPFCAEYIGSYAVGANTHSGSRPSGVTKIRLIK